ncbi:MAG: glycoside hydrolase family 5 protein [Rhizobiaceae bacterium]|nr:MAG: glycoside hydrolase family 5 protein [Rhizobiaceae bacterium]CAG1009363.1 endoglucanase [Rhizobiaceae bacterium]
MASLAYPIKTSVAALLAILLAAAPATAASFSAKRGINLDLWTTWPDETRWNDRSVILPFPEWRRTIDGADFAGLKAAGFDFVRMPVDPAALLSAQTAGFSDLLYASVLDSARLANAAGLKVIVDLHAIPAGGNRAIGTYQLLEDAALFDRYLDAVRWLARTVSREDPSLVALELMNEPVTGCEGAEARAWAERLKRLYAAARASATRTTLVLSGSCWGGAEGLAALDPRDFPDDNLIWSFHSYAPFVLTHQGATWTGGFVRWVTGLPYPPHSVPRAELDAIVAGIKEKIAAEASWTERQGQLSYFDELLAETDTPERLAATMAEPFERVSAWARKYGIAPGDILLGEFGMIRQEYGNGYVVPSAQRAAYYRDVIDLAERHGFTWSMWSYGGAFGVVEEFDGRKAEPDVMEMVRRLP